MNINDKEIDFWIENGLNVLFEGRHGVGKTAMVTEAFDRNGLNWRYFSAATMDPWVDFIGVPKEKVDESTGESFIELIRPMGFHDGKVEALFFDELNRAPAKVRNAVMELIQFKSINGKKFPNLKFVWAAINPEDEKDSDTSYDVEALDPAQQDRFHIFIPIPYEPNSSYFKKAYGEMGEGAVEFWKSLTKEQKESISPRRLEYLVNIFKSNGNIRYAIKDKSINIQKLIQALAQGSLSKKLKKLSTAKDSEIETEFNDINFVNNVFDMIIKNTDYIQRFMKFIPNDMISDAITKGAHTQAVKILDNGPEDIVIPIVESLVTSKSLNRRKINRLTKKMVNGERIKSVVSTLPETTVNVFPVGNAISTLNSMYSNTTNRDRKIHELSSYISSLKSEDICKTDSTVIRQYILMTIMLVSRSQRYRVQYSASSKQGGVARSIRNIFNALTDALTYSVVLSLFNDCLKGMSSSKRVNMKNYFDLPSNTVRKYDNDKIEKIEKILLDYIT